jgi:hypothetical protein
MISKIDISDFDDEIYDFGNFELVFADGNTWYIINEDGFFELHSIEEIKSEGNHYFLTGEEPTDKLLITVEEYQLIANLLLDKRQHPQK